ncbi:hypothetical protein WJX72_000372 [[Myrmecia] bisecta]|uniref:Uncharacterized protein n=1 Tax=[Myrmecia] bisecta TaxID=41462 RepID=A0AAW1QE09_9CHLO
MCEHDATKDRYRLVYIILCLLGVATLLPYNVFITETGYFSVRVHQPPYAAGLADNFEAILVTSNNIMTLAAYFLLLPLQHKIPAMRQVVPALWIILGLLIGEAALARRLGAAGDVVMGVTIAAVGVLGLVGSLLIVGAFAVASRFPPLYTQAVVMGQAIAGLGVSLLSFGSTWATPETEVTPTPAAVAPAAFAYFVSSAVVLVVAIAGCLVLNRLPFAMYHARPKEMYHEDSSRAGQGTDPYEETALPRPGATAYSVAGIEAAPLLDSSIQSSTTESLGMDTAKPRLGTEAAALLPNSMGRSTAQHSSTHQASKALDSLERQQPPLASDHPPARAPRAAPPVPLSELVHRLQGYALVIALNFTVTLAAFPGLTAAICSVRNPAAAFPCHASTPAGRLYGNLFVPFLFVVFNAGDLAGRIAAGLGPWRHRAPTSRSLLAYACARCVLIPGLLFCHLVTPGAWRPPELFTSDLAAIGLNLILGLTNGHVNTLALMHAPRLVPAAARERAGTVMNFALTVGLMLGSVVSLVLTSTLQQHK